MSIGTSKGAFFKTELDFSSGFEGDEKMVVNPDKMQQDKELDEIELSIDGFGIPISYKASTASTMPLGSPTEPAGALKSTGGTQVPEKVPQEEIRPEPYGLNPPDKDFHQTVGDLLFGKGENDIRPALGHFYEQMKNAFKLPGDVYAGKIDPMSPLGIERAFDLAGLAVLGPAPVAKKMADGTLGSFAGVKSKAVDKPSLYLALEAERQGIHQDEIFKGTGWFKGADKQWRYEIDDSKAVLNEKWADNPSPTQKQTGFKTAKLPEVLDHPELYEAYPQLKDYQIIYDNNYNGIAEFSGQAIKVGKQAWSGSNVPAYKDKAIIMHEVQHAIQDIEGFAKGGTPGKTNRDFGLKYEDAVDKLRPEMFELGGKEMAGEFLTAPQQARLDYLKAVFKKYNEYAKGADTAARENYLALAGETEARNVQHRIDLTAQERMKHNPRDTEDVARDKQIARKDSSLTTPYLTDGDFHTYDIPKAKGQIQKAESPTPFRRAANDNQDYYQLLAELDELSSVQWLTDDQFQRLLDLNKILTGLEKNPPRK